MKNFFYKLALTSGLLLAACNGQATPDESPDAGAPDETSLNTETNVEADATVVATVNGEEVTRAELNERVAMIAQGQGQEPEEGAVLNQLIEEKLVYQDAEAKGIAVTEAEVNEQYQAVVENAGGSDELRSQLSQLGLTPSSLRKDLESQILVQKYLESEVNLEGIAVTDAEVEAAYNEAAATQEVPPLDEQISQQIRDQLTQQKQNERVAQHVQNLRANADIQTELDAEANNPVLVEPEAEVEAETETEVEAEIVN